jgi:hypothetical protein
MTGTSSPNLALNSHTTGILYDLITLITAYDNRKQERALKSRDEGDGMILDR